MSFATDVKKELIESVSEKDCCTGALLAGIISFGGRISADDYITLSSDLYRLLDFISTLCAERYLIVPTLIKRGGSYSLSLPDATMLLTELDIVKAGEVKFSIPSIMDDCCKRAYITGAFLGGGTISSPEKQYHLEFSTPHFGLSEHFRNLLAEYDISAKTLKRKSRFVTYIKDNDIICDVLAIMGADRAALTLSEANISKSLHNLYNRRDNCESANYDKTINASVKQILAINTIDNEIGISSLPAQLRELAELRLEHRNKPLSELADILGISKSGVNHRMRKLQQIAKDLTGGQANG
ncbi:MAG: DNA-binding protein WhiA [Clostridia bacterium]|nr:DNA-binding protein WhiA [Clostridia bacterium]